MSNSPLVSYKRISPHRNSPRNKPVKKITIHHMAGNLTVEQCGAIFANPSRNGSSNYGIGTDGRIGMYCEEKDRSWCSSSPENDHQAITIEVANDQIGGNWHVSDKAMSSLIALCVDICRRNNIPRLNFTGNKNGNLTMHCYFANTACPGPYLKSKFQYIADEVNKQLAAGTAETEKVVAVGSQVLISPGSKYGGLSTARGKAVPAYCCTPDRKYVVSKIAVHNGVNEALLQGLNSWIAVSSLTAV